MLSWLKCKIHFILAKKICTNATIISYLHERFTQMQLSFHTCTRDLNKCNYHFILAWKVHTNATIISYLHKRFAQMQLSFHTCMKGSHRCNYHFIVAKKVRTTCTGNLFHLLSLQEISCMNPLYALVRLILVQWYYSVLESSKRRDEIPCRGEFGDRALLHSHFDTTMQSIAGMFEHSITLLLWTKLSSLGQVSVQFKIVPSIARSSHKSFLLERTNLPSLSIPDFLCWLRIPPT
jgi:hypothetical protein